LVQEVIELPADNKYPDCPFIEDTAVVIGNRALTTHPVRPLRRILHLLV
jgi:N-dimethylarginine dimethylaminohydrolase